MTEPKRYRITRIEHTTIDVTSSVNPLHIKWELCEKYRKEFDSASCDNLVDWEIEELEEQ